jgi:hypothetical protein
VDLCTVGARGRVGRNARFFRNAEAESRFGESASACILRGPQTRGLETQNKTRGVWVGFCVFGLKCSKKAKPNRAVVLRMKSRFWRPPRRSNARRCKSKSNRPLCPPLAPTFFDGTRWCSSCFLPGLPSLCAFISNKRHSTPRSCRPYLSDSIIDSKHREMSNKDCNGYNTHGFCLPKPVPNRAN